MKTRLILFALITSVLLNACAEVIAPAPETFPPITKEKELTLGEQIVSALESGAELEEIEKPNLTLPVDIQTGQIEKTFRLNDALFALVLRSSMNIVLNDLPPEFVPAFSGILIAKEGDTEWKKFMEIQDIQPEDSSKNNPYYLWTHEEEIFLSVVDQNGAGSGEGMMKIFKFSPDENLWELNKCYYYAGNPPVENQSDYFSFSSKLEAQKLEPMKNCLNDVNVLMFFSPFERQD